MTRDKAISDTLILAQKYNDLIEDKNLPFPRKELRILELKLENLKKTEVLYQNKAMLEELTQLKNQVS